jgi:hypothetical protein
MWNIFYYLRATIALWPGQEGAMKVMICKKTYEIEC